MLRKLVLALVCLAIVVTVFAAAGFHIERGGSGWPRFLVRSNDAALEADRVRQHALDSPDAPPADSNNSATAVQASNTPQEAAPAAPIAPNAPIAPTLPLLARFPRTRTATGATLRRRSARAGRAKDCAGCGSSLSAPATRRSLWPMAARSPSSSGAIRKWPPPTMCRPGASCGRTHGPRASKSRWAAMARARRRRITRGASTFSARKASCACSMRRRARSCGDATSSQTTARTT